MAVEDIGARRWAEVDAPDRYRDRLRLASSIGEYSGAPDGARHCGQRGVQHNYGEPEGLARRIKIPLKRRARATSWMSINCRQSSEQASAKRHRSISGRILRQKSFSNLTIPALKLQRNVWRIFVPKNNSEIAADYSRAQAFWNSHFQREEIRATPTSGLPGA
jgi:hypothetical protein